MVLWETSPLSFCSAGFLNKVTIPCLDNFSLDLLGPVVQQQYELSLETVYLLMIWFLAIFIAWATYEQCDIKEIIEPLFA